MRTNIPVAKEQGIIDAFCTIYKYQDTIFELGNKETPNPQTKKEFANACLLKFLKEVHEGAAVKQVQSTKDVAIENSKNFMADITVT